LKHRALSN